MTQAIYRCFISISEAFVNALQTDYYYARNLITKDLVTLSNVKDLFDGKKGESKFLGLLLEVVKKFENDRLKNKNIHWSAVLTEQFTFSYFSCSISSFISSMKSLFGKAWREKLKDFVSFLHPIPEVIILPKYLLVH